MRIRSLAFVVLGVVAALPIAWATWLRPRVRAWGARPNDEARPLPGDEIVADPDIVHTRAISIGAPPDAVWPWLLQLGQGRGGLYSYDWLENALGCDIHSVDRIVPELQHLGVGDIVSLRKGDMPAFLVQAIDPGRSIVLVARDPATGGPRTCRSGRPDVRRRIVGDRARAGRRRPGPPPGPIAPADARGDTRQALLVGGRGGLAPDGAPDADRDSRSGRGSGGSVRGAGRSLMAWSTAARPAGAGVSPARARRTRGAVGGRVAARPTRSGCAREGSGSGRRTRPPSPSRPCPSARAARGTCAGTPGGRRSAARGAPGRRGPPR